MIANLRSTVYPPKRALPFYPVRNSSPAIAGLETERGIISNGVKINDILPDNLLAVKRVPLQLLSSQF
jgi:hypothetical protein